MRSTGRPRPAWPSTCSATTCPRTRHRWCTSGCWPIPASSCTSPRPTPPGSARSSGGSPNCSAAAWTAACSAPSTSSPPHWRTGSRPGTAMPGPSSGPRPPTRSSTASAATAHASPNRDTSRTCLAGHGLQADDAQQRELLGVVAAGLGGVGDDSQVGPLDGADIAVQGERAHLGVVDALAVRGAYRHRPGLPQLGETGAGPAQVIDQPAQRVVVRIAGGGTAEIGHRLGLERGGLLLAMPDAARLTGEIAPEQVPVPAALC